LWRIIKEKNENDSLLRKEEREIQREANELKRMELNMISERFKEPDRLRETEQRAEESQRNQMIFALLQELRAKKEEHIEIVKEEGY
jgi:hypothetical protein